VAKYLLDDADVHALFESNVAAVCRASWTLASRTPACLRIAFQDRQSSVRSIGPPCPVAKTRSLSSQASPALSRSAACPMRTV